MNSEQLLQDAIKLINILTTVNLDLNKDVNRQIKFLVEIETEIKEEKIKNKLSDKISQMLNSGDQMLTKPMEQVADFFHKCDKYYKK